MSQCEDLYTFVVVLKPEIPKSKVGTAKEEEKEKRAERVMKLQSVSAPLGAC